MTGLKEMIYMYTHTNSAYIPCVTVDYYSASKNEILSFPAMNGPENIMLGKMSNRVRQILL